MSDNDIPPLYDQPVADDALFDPIDNDTSVRQSREQNQNYINDNGIAELAAVNVKLAERRLKLDELRFKLEERRAEHDMAVEMRELDIKHKTIERDYALQMGINEHWMKAYWRPAAGWVYLTICVMDFIVFPLLVIIAPVFANLVGVSAEYSPWTSITLSEGGLIHLSFGAILGVAAWTRSREKQTRYTNT